MITQKTAKIVNCENLHTINVCHCFHVEPKGDAKDFCSYRPKLKGH